MPHYYYNHIFNYGVVAGEGITSFPVQEEDQQSLNDAIQVFEDFCSTNQINYKVRKDFLDFALPALKKETRFADLVILTPESFSVLGPDSFELLKNFLHGAECPCLVIPDGSDFPELNILAYDGSETAVYAMKQFCYLFPQLATNETELVYANEDQDQDIPSRNFITELASQHFPDLKLEKLSMNPKKFFSAWLRGKQNSILITGSYSRSALSEILSASFVDDILKKEALPVFIAHR